MFGGSTRLDRLKAYATAYLVFWAVLNVPIARAAVIATVEHFSMAISRLATSDNVAKEGQAFVEAGTDEHGAGRIANKTDGSRFDGPAYRPIASSPSEGLPGYDILMPLALLLLMGTVVAPLVHVAGRIRRKSSQTRQAQGAELRQEPRSRTRLRNGQLRDARGKLICACHVLDRSAHGARVRVRRAVANVNELQFHDEADGVTYEARVAWIRGDQMGLSLEAAERNRVKARTNSPLQRQSLLTEDAAEEPQHIQAHPDPRWHVEVWDPTKATAILAANYDSAADLMEAMRPIRAEGNEYQIKVRVPSLLEEEELELLQEIEAEIL